MLTCMLLQSPSVEQSTKHMILLFALLNRGVDMEKYYHIDHKDISMNIIELLYSQLYWNLYKDS